MAAQAYASGSSIFGKYILRRLSLNVFSVQGLHVVCVGEFLYSALCYGLFRFLETKINRKAGIFEICVGCIEVLMKKSLK